MTLNIKFSLSSTFSVSFSEIFNCTMNCSVPSSGMHNWNSLRKSFSIFYLFCFSSWQAAETWNKNYRSYIILKEYLGLCYILKFQILIFNGSRKMRTPHFFTVGVLKRNGHRDPWKMMHESIMGSWRYWVICQTNSWA